MPACLHTPPASRCLPTQPAGSKQRWGKQLRSARRGGTPRWWLCPAPGGCASRRSPRAYEPRTRYSAVPLEEGERGPLRVPCRVGQHRTSAGGPSPEPRATAHLQGAPNLHVNDRGTAGEAMRAALRRCKEVRLQARRLTPQTCLYASACRAIAVCAKCTPGSNKCAKSRRAVL